MILNISFKDYDNLLYRVYPSVVLACSSAIIAYSSLNIGIYGTI